MNSNDITTVCNTKLTNEERETLILIDMIENVWRADSSIPKDCRKLEKMGWDVTGIVKHTDGSIISMRFKAPRNAIMIRNAKPKPPASDEDRAKMTEKMRLLRESQKSTNNQPFSDMYL